MPEIRAKVTPADLSAVRHYLEGLANGDEMQVQDTDSENADAVAMVLRDLSFALDAFGQQKYGVQTS